MVSSTQPPVTIRHEFHIINPFTRFFLWAAKTDRRIIRSCTNWTRKTHVARGFFVLATSILAFVAIDYALSTTGRTSRIAFPLALLGALVIFMFDRELVGHWSRRSLWTRFILSVFLGATVAIPLVMSLMQDRIDQQIERDYATDNKEEIGRLKLRQQEADKHEADLQNQLAELRRQAQETGRNREAEIVGRVIAGQTTGIPGEGPAYKAANERLELINLQEKAIQEELSRISEDRDRIAADYKSQEIKPVYDFPTRFEALDRATPFLSPMWKVYWAITLLFIAFDTMPVLMKLFSPVTDYDQLLAVQVNENNHRAGKIAEYNEHAISADFLSPKPSTLELFERTFESSDSTI
jgi:Domain of unknown function (DUF4407)